MSRFTHSICDDCWDKQHPLKPSIRMKHRIIDTCCFCSKKHSSGIFVRQDPADMPCNGVHPEQKGLEVS